MKTLTKGQKSKEWRSNWKKKNTIQNNETFIKGSKKKNHKNKHQNTIKKNWICRILQHVFLH
jgi:hypothetical protein